MIAACGNVVHISSEYFAKFKDFETHCASWTHAYGRVLIINAIMRGYSEYYIMKFLMKFINSSVDLFLPHSKRGIMNYVPCNVCGIVMNSPVVMYHSGACLNCKATYYDLHYAICEEHRIINNIQSIQYWGNHQQKIMCKDDVKNNLYSLLQLYTNGIGDYVRQCAIDTHYGEILSYEKVDVKCGPRRSAAKLKFIKIKQNIIQEIRNKMSNEMCNLEQESHGQSHEEYKNQSPEECKNESKNIFNIDCFYEQLVSCGIIMSPIFIKSTQEIQNTCVVWARACMQIMMIRLIANGNTETHIIRCLNNLISEIFTCGELKCIEDFDVCPMCGNVFYTLATKSIERNCRCGNERCEQIWKDLGFYYKRLYF